jgi:ribosome maturation factor RimP
VFKAQQDATWVTVGHEDFVLEVRAIAERVARSFGLELFDVQLRRESIGWVIRVYIDGPQTDFEAAADPTQESVNLDDCQRVSRDLSAVLDADVTFDHAYTLEVSSPGLDRPLRHLNDCRRFAGRLAKIVTREAVDGLNYIAGRITGVENDHVIIDTGHGFHRIPWSAVSRARLEVEF